MAVTTKPKTATRKTSRKSTKRASARKAAAKVTDNVVKAATAATPKASAFTNPMSSLSSFSMPSSTTDAMKQWSSIFKQPTAFKMESLMPTPTFPQFDQFQTQYQTAANQYSNFLTKAQTAAEKSRTRLTSGLEECTKTAASIAQSNMQRRNEGMRKLMTCKSLNEFADVQNQLFKQNYEAMSAETAKLVELVTKTVASASEPMNDLAASAMTEAKKNIAA